MFYTTIFIDRIFTKGREELVKNNICSFGNSLILADNISAIVIGFGSFGDSGAPVRISIVDSDMSRVTSCSKILKDIIKNHISDFSYKVEDNKPDYISKLEDGDRDYDIFNMVGFIPPMLNLNQVTEDMLWMSKFLDRIYEMKEGYILLVLRPMIKTKKKDGNKGSPLYNLLRSMYWSYDLYEQEIQKELKKKEKIHSKINEEFERETKRSGNRNDCKETIKQTHTNNQTTNINFDEYVEKNIYKVYDHSKINILFQKNLEFIYSAMTSGAWWLSIYIISKPYAQLIRLISIYWSFIAKIGNMYSGKSDIYGRRPLLYKKIDKISIFKDLQNEPNMADKVSTYKILRTHEIDILHFIKELKVKTDDDRELMTLLNDDGLTKILEDVSVPYIYEIPVTGNRISSVFQFPHYSTPMISVENGFDYCFRNVRDSKDDSFIKIGSQIESLIEKKEDGYLDIATIDLTNLTKHMLIVGTTGSGKTNSVITIVNSIKKKSPGTNIFILEGAKREYRKFELSNFEIIDLVNKYLRINIFAHPLFISFESHISNLCNIINSCLELPVPLPALMSEAIYRAYISYINNNNEMLKNKNPILFFLFRSVMEVVNKAGYGGEIGSNIDAAIRTRLRQLLTGATGKVLDCNDNWETICKNMLNKDSVIELESIGDNRVRSFIMSLFALYYRYAVEEDYRKKTRGRNSAMNKLSRVLVLEEAHRIIGKATVPKSIGEDSVNTGEHLEMFSNMLSEIRAFNCGIIISDQSPSKLIPDSMKNTNTKLIMKLVSSDDIMAVVESSGLPDEACKDIPKLSTGQAILLTGSEKPSLIKVDKANLGTGTEMDIIKPDISKDIKYLERSFVFIDLFKNLDLAKDLSDKEVRDCIRIIDNKVKDYDRIYKIHTNFRRKCEEHLGSQKYRLLFYEKIDTNKIQEFKRIMNEVGKSIKGLSELEKKLIDANVSDDVIMKIKSNLQMDLKKLEIFAKCNLENEIDEQEYEKVRNELISKSNKFFKPFKNMIDEIIKKYEKDIVGQLGLTAEEKRGVILDIFAIFYELME